MESGWTKVPENKKVYMLWFDMLRRCYDDAQIKRDRGSSYKNCIVCDRWFYLSKFYEDIQKLNGYKEWTNIICGAEESGMNISEYAEYISSKADECRARLEGNP